MAKKAIKKEDKPKKTTDKEVKTEQTVEGENFYIDVVPVGPAVEEVVGLMESRNMQELELPVVPIQEISNFIDEGRPNLYTYVLPDLSEGSYFEVVARGVSDAKALRGMLKSNELDGLPVPPLELDNLKKFLGSSRKSVAQLEIVRTKVKKEELPGHLE